MSLVQPHLGTSQPDLHSFAGLPSLPCLDPRAQAFLNFNGPESEKYSKKNQNPQPQSHLQQNIFPFQSLLAVYSMDAAPLRLRISTPAPSEFEGG